MECALPSGGHVVLREATSLRAADKMVISRKLAEADTGTVQALQFVGEIEVAKVLVTAWDLPYEPGARIPADDPDVFGRLTIADYDTIIAACRPALSVLYPSRPTPDDAEVPGSPTGPTDD